MKRSLLLAVSLPVSLAFSLAAASASAQAPGASRAPRAEPGAPAEPGARAEPAPDAADGDGKVRRAQSHFQRGVQLYEEENYEGALAEFSRAHELVPNYRILYNLAQTQVERHDYVEAVRLFGEYLEQGGNDVPAARRVSTARERDGLLERIASVQLESNVGGAELWIDGHSRGIIPSSTSLRLNSGRTELRVEKPGYIPVTRELTLAGGDSLVVELNLDRSALPAPPLAGSAEPVHAEASNTGLWLSVAATTVLAGATATFAVVTANQNRDLDRELGRFQADSTELDHVRSRVRTFAALTDGFGVATVLSFGSMLYFILRDSGAHENVRPSPAEALSSTPFQVLVGGSSIALRKDF